MRKFVSNIHLILLLDKSLKVMFLRNSSLSSLLKFVPFTVFSIFNGRFKEKKWDSKRMLSSGGMPSSHSAGVSALAVAIGVQEGTSGSAFALAVVLACVVCTSSPDVLLNFFFYGSLPVMFELSRECNDCCCCKSVVFYLKLLK